MEDWPEYQNHTVPNSCVMDQITQQAALLSARIGIEVAPISIYEYESWKDAFKVRPSATNGHVVVRSILLWRVESRAPIVDPCHAPSCQQRLEPVTGAADLLPNV